MEYSKIENIVKELKKIDVKGKDYIEVNQRVIAFRKLFPEGRIETEILDLENGQVVIRANIYGTKEDNRPIATGIAYEKEGSTFINKTSFIENCETSAVGRALGMLGIGIETSIASAEEVSNAILQQQNETLIDKVHKEALEASIAKNNIPDDVVEKILSKYGCTSTAEITNSQYSKIVADFKKLKVME